MAEIVFLKSISDTQIKEAEIQWLRLDLRGIKDVKHPKITPYSVGDWVYVHVEKEKDIDDIIDLVKTAYEKAV